LSIASAGPKQFLDKLWRRPNDNGNFVQSYFGVAGSPFIKSVYSIIGFAAFLCVYVSYLVSLPGRNQPHNIEITPIEVVFWGWTFTFVLSEAYEAVGFDSVRAYLRGSGNKVDVLVLLVFLASFAARCVVHATDAQMSPNQPTLQMDLLFALLCLNLVPTPACLLRQNNSGISCVVSGTCHIRRLNECMFELYLRRGQVFCCLRFLFMLSINARVGVMVIITQKIVT